MQIRNFVSGYQVQNECLRFESHVWSDFQLAAKVSFLKYHSCFPQSVYVTRKHSSGACISQREVNILLRA